MPGSRRTLIASPIVLVLALGAAGCGSSAKPAASAPTSTQAAAPPPAATATATSTVPRASTGSTGPSVTGSAGAATRHAGATARPPHRPAPASPPATPPASEPALAQVPASHRLPPEITGKFLAACRAAGGTTASCRCVMQHQELRTLGRQGRGGKVIEKGEVIAELLALEVEMRGDHVTFKAASRGAVPLVLPPYVRASLRACST